MVADYTKGKGFSFPLMINWRVVLWLPFPDQEKRNDKFSMLSNLIRVLLKTFKWSANNKFEATDEYEVEERKRSQ